MGTTLESSKGGGRGPAKTPKPTSSSGEYMSSQNQQAPTSTHSMCLASTTQQTLPREEYSDPPTNFFPLSPSPALSCPSFETRQKLQLGLATSISHPSDTSSMTTQVTNPSPASTVRDSARSSSQPQQPGMTPSRLQILLAKKSVERRQGSEPHPAINTLCCNLPPSRTQCPAKERLLKWRPLLTADASPSGDNLEKCYQLTALAWEPSMLTSYASGLLVFHTWCDSRNLPEEQRAPVSQDTIASFITDLAGAYTGDTIANYVQGVRAWHRIYNIPWNIDELHTHTMLKGTRKVTPEATKLPKRQPLLVEDIVAVRAQLDLTQLLDAAVFACLMSPPQL